MKEIVNDIWNAPKEQAVEMLNQAIMIYLIVTAISAILGWVLFNWISNRMDKRDNKYRTPDGWYDFNADPFFNKNKRK